jgi:hypothetical protein
MCNYFSRRNLIFICIFDQAEHRAFAYQFFSVNVAR